jgi:hypothetical protein
MSIFDPQVDDEIQISKKHYKFLIHPNAKNSVLSSEGRRATVYKLLCLEDNLFFALKVFKQAYRNDELHSKEATFQSYSGLKGIKVSSYECITKGNNPELLNSYYELEFAVLMPWINGDTWFEIITNKTKAINYQGSISLSLLLLNILCEFELKRMSHGDISSSNIVIQFSDSGNPVGIELIDIDDFFMSDITRPTIISKGTDGYGHESIRKNGNWDELGDRFSGAILLIEMLCSHHLSFQENINGESFFNQSELQQVDSKRYEIIKKLLGNMDEKLQNLFEKAWFSKELSECPAFLDWREIIYFNLNGFDLIQWEIEKSINYQNDEEIIRAIKKKIQNNQLLTKFEWENYSTMVRRVSSKTRLNQAILEGNSLAIFQSWDQSVLTLNFLTKKQKEIIRINKEQLHNFYEQKVYSYLQLLPSINFEPVHEFQQAVPNVISKNQPTMTQSVDFGSSAVDSFLQNKTDRYLFDLWLSNNISETSIHDEIILARLNNAILFYGFIIRLNRAYIANDINEMKKIISSYNQLDNIPTGFKFPEWISKFIKTNKK